MIELAIGTRFHYKGKLCEVVELEHKYDYNKCSKCDMSFTECNVMNCALKSRKDGKSVCFKLVEDEGGKRMKLSEIIDVECNDAAIKEVKKMVYRDLEIYAVKRSINCSDLSFGLLFGSNTEWWCGYVEIPEDMHNLFKPEGHLDETILDELDDPDSYDLAHVHEGYTYLDYGIPLVVDKDHRLFLGWDYNHCCDIGADVTYNDVIDDGKRVIDSMLEKMKEDNNA